jgi:hypothetical protein
VVFTTPGWYCADHNPSTFPLSDLYSPVHHHRLYLLIIINTVQRITLYDPLHPTTTASTRSNTSKRFTRPQLLIPSHSESCNLVLWPSSLRNGASPSNLPQISSRSVCST